MLKTYLASTAVVCFGLLICFSTCLSFTIFGILTVCSIFLGAFAVIWVHILLSSPYKTGAMTEQVNHELDVFRTKLMVRNNKIICC